MTGVASRATSLPPTNPEKPSNRTCRRSRPSPVAALADLTVSLTSPAAIRSRHYHGTIFAPTRRLLLCRVSAVLVVLDLIVELGDPIDHLAVCLFSGKVFRRQVQVSLWVWQSPRCEASEAACW